MSEAPAERRRGYGAVFARGEFRWLWLADVQSLLGDQLARVALTVLAVGARLQRELRDRDAVGRFGGEEFAAVLAGVGADEAVTVAERICAALREVRVDEVSITASVGVAHHRAGRDAVTVEALLARADAALYAAKRQGRNQVRVGALVDSM